MILRVKMHGSGKPDDAYRAKLPTYSHIHGNVAEGVALVSVSPERLGLELSDLKNEKAIETTEGPYYPQLSDATLRKIRDHFADAYAGMDFQIEIPEVANDTARS